MKNEEKKILWFILIVLLVVYLVLPPYNKIAQFGYICNSIKLCFNAKEVDEYIFHRNNAVYLVKMDNPKAAIREIDKAIAKLPSTAPDETLYKLLYESANIKMLLNDYKGALDDLMKIPTHNISECLTVAMLLKELNNRKLAVTYCNKIIDIDIKAYAGYACIADVYGSVAKYDASVMIYDLLIDRSPNKAKYYADRAMYKEKAGDMKGAKQDMDKARELSPILDTKSSITYDAIHPKKVNFEIYKF